jgi:XTP/dITP diphosphohydrolase
MHRRRRWPAHHPPADAVGPPLRLVLASANPDKAREVAEVLADVLGPTVVELVPRPTGVPDVVEDGATLEDNARLKAQALVAATGEAAAADDTGLEVAALGGAPGVVSARWAGPAATYADNVAKLLAELAGSPDRRARFRTVALVAFPGGRELRADGVVEGVIAPHPRGTGGFGYDSVFVPDGGGGRTFAEMSAVEKHALSHRGHAFRALAALLV